MQAAEAGPDQRLALNDASTEPTAVSDVGQDQQIGMSVAPPAGPNTSQGPTMSVQPPPGPTPAPAPATPPPPQLDEDEQLRAQQQAYINAPVYHAPVKGGLRPKAAEIVSEGAEAPMSSADWQELQRANESIMQAKVATTGLLVGRAEQQAAEAQAALPELQNRYLQSQKELEDRQASARQDLAHVQSMLQDVNSRRVDHGRFFARQGTVGNIVAGIAQMLGAFAATVGHTENFAKQIIDQRMASDIAEQREEIENGRASANNALQMFREKYKFDIPQAESALKIAQFGVVNAQLKQFEGMKLSQDAQAELQNWFAENQKAQFLEARKLYTASMGKQTRKESLTYQQGSAGGYAAPTHAEKMGRYGEIEAGQKTGTILKPGEGEPKLNRNLVIQGLDGTQVEARSEQEAIKIRDMRALQLNADRSAKELEKLSTIGNAINPATYHKYVGHLEAMVNSANTLFGQGVVRGEDLDRWRKQILGDQYGIGAAEAAKEMREIINNAYQSRVDAQMGAAVTEKYRKGKPEARYGGARATTPTVTPRGAAEPSDDRLLEELRKYGEQP